MSEDDPQPIEPKRLRKSPAAYRKFTKEIADTICEYIAQGMTLRQACKQPGMPDEAAVRLWVLENRGDISPQYARARELLLEHWADQLIEICDDDGEDFIPGQDGKFFSNNAAVNRDRLRIDTRKWLLSKLRPEKYGELLRVDQKTTITKVEDTPEELAVEKETWESTYKPMIVN